MFKKTLGIFAVFLIASLVLVVSILRSAAVRYSFHLAPTPQPEVTDKVAIEYELPYPGKVTPTNILWPVKVIRDKAWLLITTNNLKKAEIALLFADKRMSAGVKLFELGKVGDAITVVMKAEFYLEESLRYAQEARKEGMETKVFIKQLSLAALKHREVMENLRVQAPEDARPLINQTTDHSKKVYEQTSHILQEMGEVPASNPFED